MADPISRAFGIHYGRKLAPLLKPFFERNPGLLELCEEELRKDVSESAADDSSKLCDGVCRPAKLATSRKEKADSQIIAALSTLHDYENGSVGKHGPFSQQDIATAAGVVKGTVSKFWARTDFFKSYVGYCRSCQKNEIAFHLKMLNREFSELATLDPSKVNQVADDD